jgi:hypothetical protein
MEDGLHGREEDTKTEDEQLEQDVALSNEYVSWGQGIHTATGPKNVPPAHLDSVVVDQSRFKKKIKLRYTFCIFIISATDNNETHEFLQIVTAFTFTKDEI